MGASFGIRCAPSFHVIQLVADDLGNALVLVPHDTAERKVTVHEEFTEVSRDAIRHFEASVHDGSDDLFRFSTSISSNKVVISSANDSKVFNTSFVSVDL